MDKVGSGASTLEGARFCKFLLPLFEPGRGSLLSIERPIFSMIDLASSLDDGLDRGISKSKVGLILNNSRRSACSTRCSTDLVLRRTQAIDVAIWCALGHSRAAQRTTPICAITRSLQLNISVSPRMDASEAYLALRVDGRHQRVSVSVVAPPCNHLCYNSLTVPV
jgi:hypothetical protein